jgi:TorA maturation chaperone TorD
LAKQTDSFPETARSAAIAEERSDLYCFLSRVFRAPLSASMLRKIRSKTFMEALSAAGVTLDSGFVAGTEASLLEALAVDFTYLFHGPGGHIAPYESVQTARDGGELNGPAATAVRHAIETSGFHVDPEARQLPDHIAVELEIMSALLRREADAWREIDRVEVLRCRDDQRSFFISHLGVWGQEFGRRIQEKAETSFYRAVGKLLADFIELEASEFRRPSEESAVFTCEEATQ